MNNETEEKIQRGFNRLEKSQPRFSVQFKIQLGPVGIIYPQLGPPAFYR